MPSPPFVKQSYRSIALADKYKVIASIVVITDTNNGMADSFSAHVPLNVILKSITEPESPLSVPCSSILVYLLLLLFSNFTNPSCVVAATTASQAPSEVNSSKFVAFSRAKRFKTTWKGLSLLCRRYIPLGLTTRRT